MAERKPLDFTASELAWTLVAMFLLGGLAGWGLFGAPRLIDEAVAHSGPADWIVAAGTWVIGYGAVRYAREAHVLRTLELAEKQREGLRFRNAARSDFFNRMMFLYSARNRIQIQKSGIDKTSTKRLKFELKNCVREIGKFEIRPDDKSILTGRSQVSLARAQGVLNILVSRIDDYLENYANEPDTEFLSDFDRMYLEMLAERGDELTVELDRIRANLKEETERLS